MSGDRPDDELDEAALVARAASDVDAFEALYRRYVRRVTGFAVRRCDSPEDAADVVAQTFVRLLRRAHLYDAERGTVAAFVFALARSEVADARRRANRDRALTDRVAGHQLLSRDDISRLEEALDAARATALLADSFARLPPAEGEVLRLVAAGLSPSEAAARLDITPEAARTRLSRARHRVRAHPAAPAADPIRHRPARPAPPVDGLPKGSP